MKVVLAAILVLVSLAVNAQEGKGLQQIQEEESLQRAVDKLNELDASLKSMVNQRDTDCLKAVGYQPFCSCILKGLPVAWSFSDYVAITTQTKEKNGYSDMDADFRAAYDKVIPIRDKCVKAINAP